MCGHYTTWTLCCPLADLANYLLGFNGLQGMICWGLLFAMVQIWIPFFRVGNRTFQTFRGFSQILSFFFTEVTIGAAFLQQIVRLRILAAHLRDRLAGHLIAGAQEMAASWSFTCGTQVDRTACRTLKDFLDWNSLMYFFHNVGIHRFYYMSVLIKQFDEAPVALSVDHAAAPWQTGTLSSYDTLVLPRCGGCCALAANLRTSLKILQRM